MKKAKILQKDLDAQFKEINDLKHLTLNQEKYNALVSQIISNMSLDENLDEEKSEMKNDDVDKQSKPQNQDQKTKHKEDKYEEMSIESGIPDIESETKELIKLKKILK